MILYGTSYCVGDDISTDDIIAPAQRGADDPALLAAHCLAGVDPTIAEHARMGDILLAGARFGAGAEAETAVLALQALGFAAIVCAGADAGFVALAESHGLPVLICTAAVAALAPGSVLRLDLARGQITDRGSGALFQAPPCAPALVAAVRRSQLLARMRRVVEEEGFDG